MRPGTYSLTLTLMYMLCTQSKEREQTRGKESKTGNMLQYVVENQKHVLDILEKQKRELLNSLLLLYLVFT